MYFVFCLNFRILFRTLNHQYDYTFDWTMLKQRPVQQAGSKAITNREGAEPRGDGREKDTKRESEINKI